MKKLSCIAFALFCLLAAVSCIEEELDACPPEGGNVTVAIRVEKFRTRPPYADTDFEPEFTDRIHSLDYLLYADGRLIAQGPLQDVSSTRGGLYRFSCDTLPFGAYRLALAGNTAPRMTSGTTEAPERLYIMYQGEKEGDDHFRADLPFEVSCPCRNEYETVMRRVHGVTRFRFENLTPEIVSVEVSLSNVGARIPLSGEPDRPCTVSKRIFVENFSTNASGAFTLGTFATLPGEKTAWRLRLYGADPSEALFDRIVRDDLRIESNQLTELTARFREGDFLGEIEFSVDVDPTWDGVNEGGGQVTVSQASGLLPKR